MMEININLRCPGEIGGNVSVGGVGQLTPFADRVAFVICVLPAAVKAQKNCPSKTGKLSITKLS